MIPANAYVTSYFGEVFPVAAYERLMAQGRDPSYSMDMCCRPDVGWAGEELAEEDCKKR